MPNSPCFRRLAKGCRLKTFRSQLTPAFSTLAHPTFNPFVSYLFQEHGGWGGQPKHLLGGLPLQVSFWQGWAVLTLAFSCGQVAIRGADGLGFAIRIPYH